MLVCPRSHQLHVCLLPTSPSADFWSNSRSRGWILMILRHIPGSVRSHLYSPSYILCHLLYLLFSDKTLTSTDMHKLERILNPVWHLYHWMWEMLGSYTLFIRINIWFHYYSDIYSLSIFYLFMSWLFYIFIVAQAFSSLAEWGLLSGCGVRAFHCSGFSCWRMDCRSNGLT